MKNADMSAFPQMKRDPWGNYHHSGGLTKREMIAKDIAIGEFKFNSFDDMADFIGRDVDQKSMKDLIKASAECDAKIRAIYADALLKELEE